MAITAKQAQKIVDEFKAIEREYWFEDAETLATVWFVRNENFHDNWNLLSTDVQNMWIMAAQIAMNELKRGI